MPQTLSCGATDPQTCCLSTEAQPSPFCLGFWNCQNPQVWVSVAASLCLRVIDPVVLHLFVYKYVPLRHYPHHLQKLLFCKLLSLPQFRDLTYGGWELQISCKHRNSLQERTLQFQKTQSKYNQATRGKEQEIDQSCGVGPSFNQENDQFIYINFSRSGQFSFSNMIGK